MDLGIKTHAVYFDFSSAFDCVHHNILLWKLKHEFFIQGDFLRLITAFLSGRTGAVKLNGIISQWIADKIGVPQGGSLSPILYLLYVDNIGII